MVDGFENAVHLGTLPNFVSQEGVNNHYFAFPINYKGERSYVFCRAVQDANKNRLYVHEVFVIDKIKKGNPLQTAAFQPHGGIALYRDILANVLDRSSSSESGTSSIGHAENFAPAISLQSRGDVVSSEKDEHIDISPISADKVTESIPSSQENRTKKSTQAAIESASAEVETSSSEAQKTAGNYKMGHVKVGAFDVTIENPKGSERCGTDANGKKWSVKMNNTYGYIRGTEGVDGDHIDVFLAGDMDKWDGKYVFVVDQYNPDGSFDEHKVMLGFNDMDEAKSDYLSNYEKGWENGRRFVVDRIKTDDFQKWVDSSHRKTKPFAHYVIAGAADVAEGKPKNESDRAIPPSTSGKVRMQKTQGYSEFAEKYGVNADDVRAYAEGMALGNVVMANQAFTEIRRTKRIEHRGMKLSEFAKAFNPIKEELYEKFGNVDELNQEYERRAEEERNMMEAARKKAEEEERKRQAHLDELSLLDDAAIDERYMEALQRGDEATAREMLDEAARRKGYGDTASDYQGVGAWVAPANPGYENDAERRADVEDNAPDVNIEDIALGYSLVDEKYWQEPRKYMQTDATAIESVNAIREAIAAVRRGEKNVKVKVYRAVPTSVKEGKLRNGDWVTPSKDYAKMHGEHRLEGKYRIIEDEVSVNELWWDGNDSREWGFDNGKGYKYKNVKNNRKSDDLVTRDDKGNVIPPSKRFNQRKADERYQKADTPLTPNSAEVALRDAIADLMRKSGLDVLNTKEGQRVLDEAKISDDIRTHAMLSSLVKAANVIRGWLANNKRGKSFTIELPTATQHMVRRAMGRDFDSHNITANGVAHAQKNHGVGGQKLNKKSIPLTKADMELIPYIMTAPDYVRRGSDDVSGRVSVRFYKELTMVMW